MRKRGDSSLKRILVLISIFGPAILVSVELFDPASIVTATAAGATCRFDVLWAALYSGIMLIGIQEVSARLGVVTGKTLAENIHERYGPRYSLPLFSISLVMNIGTLTAEIMGMSLAISFLLGIPYALAIAGSILLIILLIFVTSYDALEKILIVLVTAIFLSYIYFLLSLHAPIDTIAYNSLVPSLSASSLYYAMAMIGASIMPTYVILHSGLVYEKGWAHHHEKSVEDLIRTEDRSIRKERIDSGISIFAGTLLSIIIIASAAMLIGGASITSFTDIAKPFSIKFGTAGVTVFAIAFALAGILAIVTVGLGSVYSAFGFFGLGSRMNDRRFRLAFVLALVASAMLALMPDQIRIIVYTQYLNGLLLPFILIPLVAITRNKELMGKYVLRGFSLVFALATISITAAIFVANLALIL